jgi:hypothetical protein
VFFLVTFCIHICTQLFLSSPFLAVVWFVVFLVLIVESEVVYISYLVVELRQYLVLLHFVGALLEEIIV